MFRKLIPSGRRRRAPHLRAEDAVFMGDLREAMLVRSSTGARSVLYLVAVVLIVGLTWARFARVEEVTRGEATIISPSHEQVIQVLEGGIVREVMVHEGEHVEKGQLLVKIDPTSAEASYRELRAKAIDLEASISRLRAQAYDLPLHFSEEVRQAPGIVEQETTAYRSRIKVRDQRIAALRKSQALVQREIDMSAPLAEKGLISEVEILRMQRQAADMHAQIVEVENRFRYEAGEELSRYESDYAQAREALAGRAGVLARTDVVAPMNGVVKNIRVHTSGGVVQPGEHIMEIAPLDGHLLVEARIKPSDVAFLRTGLPALVKLSAYDFGIYGGIDGKVIRIGPDTLKDDQKAATGRPDAHYYRLVIETDSATLDAGGKALPILAGMQATVDIRTGEKSVLDYLLKPIFKAREAFRER
ncbi:MAG: HlyD family type I secretion periplasmic adaptor subunit [Burkholderia sp.]